MTLHTRFDRFALGRLPAGTMNKTEKLYSQHLELRRADGDVLWWKFEGIKLRLADNTFYTCDFALMLKDGQMEMHEIKGFMQDDANVKIKVAASIYPFPFFVVRRSKSFWNITPVGSNRVPENQTNESAHDRAEHRPQSAKIDH